MGRKISDARVAEIANFDLSAHNEQLNDPRWPKHAADFLRRLTEEMQDLARELQRARGEVDQREHEARHRLRVAASAIAEASRLRAENAKLRGAHNLALSRAEGLQAVAEDFAALAAPPAKTEEVCTCDVPGCPVTMHVAPAFNPPAETPEPKSHTYRFSEERFPPTHYRARVDGRPQRLPEDPAFKVPEPAAPEKCSTCRGARRVRYASMDLIFGRPPGPERPCPKCGGEDDDR